jgi:hypothetical protein
MPRFTDEPFPLLRSAGERASRGAPLTARLLATPYAASRRSPSQSVRNPTTWFQLGIIGDAGPEIMNGLRAFRYVATSKHDFDRTPSTTHTAP